MLYKMPGMVVGHASDVVQDAGHAEKMESSVQRAGGAAGGCSGAKLEDKEKRTAAPWVAGLSDTRAKLGESGSTGKFMEFWRSSSH